MTSFLLDWLIPSAHAALQDTGAGTPGVSEMWAAICSVLKFCNIAGSQAPQELSDRAIGFLFPLVTLGAVCSVIYAGFKMVTGGEEGFGDAKTIIFYACIGVVLALLAGAVVMFIGTYLVPLLFS